MARSYKRDSSGRFAGGGGGGGGGRKGGGSSKPKRKPDSAATSRRVQRAATIAARADAAVRKLPLDRSGNYRDGATAKRGNRLLRTQYTAEKALAHYAKKSSGRKRK